MKKDKLKNKFIELRAKGYTYDEICKRLGITRPTAIKWGKLFADEIWGKKKYLISKIFAERIVEQEQGILLKLDNFRKKRYMKLTKKTSDSIDHKLLKGLDKIFLKKIKAIHLKMNEDYVKSALFIFDDDIKVEERRG